MSDAADTRLDRARHLWWISGGAICVIAVTLLVTGLVVPGFLIERSKSSALPDSSGAAAPADSHERPWAIRHLNPRLAPDAAVDLLSRQFVSRLNTGHVAAAIDMLCPMKRDVIRDAVIWTARHRADLQIVTPMDHAAAPGYIIVRFVGAIEGKPRRGTFGIDAGPKGEPLCVSTFYSVG